jgi:hypothetical protein
MADILTTISGTMALLSLISVADGSKTSLEEGKVREFVSHLPDCRGRISYDEDDLLHAPAEVYNEDAFDACMSSYTVWAEEIAKDYAPGEELALGTFGRIDTPRREQALMMAEALANEAGATGREQMALARARMKPGPKP